MADTESQDQSRSSELMKRRLRTTLRQLRESAGKNQKEVAEKYFWHPTKIMRIESGASSVSPSDVQLLLQEYGVEEEGLISELQMLAVRSRQPDVWDRFRKVLKNEAITLASNEGGASVIYKYEPSLIPGLFQTERYARAMLEAVGAAPDSIEDQVEFRKVRQEMLSRSSHPHLDFIVGEAALSRPVVDSPALARSIMREQVERLKDLVADKHIQIRVLLFEAGLFRGLGSPYTVLQFTDPNLADLVYLEQPDRQSVNRDEPEQVKMYLDRFAKMSDRATEPEDLAKVLDKIFEQRFA